MRLSGLRPDSLLRVGDKAVQSVFTITAFGRCRISQSIVIPDTYHRMGRELDYSPLAVALVELSGRKKKR